MGKYNNEYHPANLLSALEVPWQQIEIQDIDDAGPCVAIHWPDDNSFAMVPIKCIKPERKDSIRRMNSDVVIKTPHEAMAKSMSIAGKELSGKIPILGTNHPDKFVARDNETNKWIPVHILNMLQTPDLPLKVLATHACYPETGDYSVVFWESDCVMALVPNSYLRLRDDKVHSSSDDSRSDDSSSDDESEYDKVASKQCVKIQKD